MTEFIKSIMNIIVLLVGLALATWLGMNWHILLSILVLGITLIAFIVLSGEAAYEFLTRLLPFLPKLPDDEE